jgi:PKHD-type hydroxylase
LALLFNLREPGRFGFYQSMPDAFNDKECDRILEIGEKLQAEQAKIEDQDQDLMMRNNTIRWIPLVAATKGLYERLGRLVIGANNQIWNMRVDGMVSEVQFTEYTDEGSHYDWHMDYGPGQCQTRKLSISIQLSDPKDYEGGNLEFASARVDQEQLRKRGAAIIFPSFMLHRVTPIISGKRRSLVAWVDGPTYA